MAIANLITEEQAGSPARVSSGWKVVLLISVVAAGLAIGALAGTIAFLVWPEVETKHAQAGEPTNTADPTESVSANETRGDEKLLEQDYAEDMDGDERIESLIERVSIEGKRYIELSPVGQIFQETFRDRFASERDEVLPPPVPAEQKADPTWEASGHIRNHPEIMEFMKKVTAANPFVRRCSTYYYNPDLSERSRFRKSGKGIECVYSNGTWTAKIRVETSAKTEGQENACAAALNVWLHGQ